MRDINWAEFYRTHQEGLKRYFFKDNMDEERMVELRKSYKRYERKSIKLEGN
jgi:hypothetical protein